MGLRQDRPKLILTETATVGDLMTSGYAVWERCSRCDRTDRLDLAAIEAERGPLFTFWNHEPACPACGDAMSYQAKKAAKGDHGRAWPIHMRGADPVQVAFIEERWRADRLTGELGSLLALRLAVEALHFLTRFGVGSQQDWQTMIQTTVKVLPMERQGDAIWLIEHYLQRDRDRPGWR